MGKSTILSHFSMFYFLSGILKEVMNKRSLVVTFTISSIEVCILLFKKCISPPRKLSFFFEKQLLLIFLTVRWGIVFPHHPEPSSSKIKIKETFFCRKNLIFWGKCIQCCLLTHSTKFFYYNFM